jgi:porphobilinogen synthase
MEFPYLRLRRLRKSQTIRDMVRETHLSVKDFIYPLFVVHGKNKKEEIKSMPGIFRYSVDRIMEEVDEVYELGIPAVILFGIPSHKDEQGNSALRDDGEVQQAVRRIKKKYPDMVVITDVCLCEYTSHGHCGILTKKGDVDNDATLEVLAEEALSHARAGADIVAPSDMMDGRVLAIREKLDENGYEHIPILSYSVKYASAFYGPFRDAAESTPAFGDRRSYQMDPGNAKEAIREATLDINEGADMIMVKPALSYLDIISLLADEFPYPIVAYNVSGEYSMVKAAGKLGWIDENRVMMEILLSIKRAGADLIITYHAKEAAKLLQLK